jgi:transcriptional regulator with XRE-family HTH domain
MFGSQLRSARRSASLTQQQVAVAARSSRTAVNAIENSQRNVSIDIALKLLASSGHSLIVIPSNAGTVNEFAASIAEELTHGRRNYAYRALLTMSDVLAKQTPGVRAALTVLPPNPVGDDLFDASIAAVADYWLDNAGIPSPEWTADPACYLSSPTHLSGSRYDFTPEMDEVPEAFLRHNVLLDRRALESI